MALSFNGTSQYLSMDSASSLINLSEGTMTVAAKIPAAMYTGSGAKGIVEIGRLFFSNSWIGLRCGGGFVYAQYRNFGTDYFAGTATTNPYHDTWTFFAVGWTTTNIYLVANTDLFSGTIGSAISLSFTQIRAASDAAGSASNFLQGELEDIRIYDRLIDFNESLTIYALNGSDMIINGLIGRWLCKESPPGGTLSSIPDLSINGNNATANNSPVYSDDILAGVRRRVANI